MATITLTTSYQQISSFALTYGTIKTYAKYTSQSVENNQTTVALKSTFTLASGWVSFSFDSATAKLDNTTKSYTSRTTFNKGETTIQTKSIPINHNTDGSSPTKSVATSWTASYGGSGSATGSIKAPKIDRYPIISNADNFNDEDNPVITYSTTMGFTSATVYAGIFDTSDNALAGYREVNVENGSYTFNLTSAERTAMQNATPNSNTMNVVFKLKTVANNTNYISSVTKTLTIVDAQPGFQPYSKTETNSKVVTLLGSSSANTVVEKASKVHFVIYPGAFKGASITSVSAYHNGITQTKTTAPYEFDINILNQYTTITAIDSRGNEAGEIITIPMLSYTPMNIDGLTVKRYNPTSSNIVINMTSPYQAQIGSYTNSLYVGYKLSGASSYTQIPSSKYTISGNTLSMNNSVIENVLSYQTKDDVILVVMDALIEDTESRTIPKGIATFEYGATDLQVNGDLFIADTSRNNPVNVLSTINGLMGDVTDLSTAVSNIIESGYISSGNTGYYIKFADGTMITRHTAEGNAKITTTWGNGYTTGANNTISLGNFPVAFLSGSTPYVWITAVRDGNNFWLGTCNGTNATTAGVISLLRFTSSTTDYKLRVLAIGRWK